MVVEAVGIEPTSEERVWETSTCVAFVRRSRRPWCGRRLPTQPASPAKDPDPVRGTTSPSIHYCDARDRRGESTLLSGRDCLSSQCQIIVGSCVISLLRGETRHAASRPLCSPSKPRRPRGLAKNHSPTLSTPWVGERFPVEFSSSTR